MEKQTGLQTSQTHIGLESESTDNTDKFVHLTREETRQIVTPYAFFVADDLLGTPLAGPFRRGFGLLIDLFFRTFTRNPRPASALTVLYLPYSHTAGFASHRRSASEPRGKKGSRTLT